MKFLVENVQFIFGALDIPTKYSPEAPEKYFAKFLVSEEKTIKKLEKAIEKVAIEKFKKLPKDLRDFIFEPDLDKYPEQDSCMLFNAANIQNKPKLFDRQRESVNIFGKRLNGDSSDAIYRGCYVNVSIGLYSYDHKGTKGVSANLYGVQFFKDGEPLGESANADDFTDYATEYDTDFEESSHPLG